MKRTLTALILALLLPLAWGQTPHQDLFAQVLASDIDGITYDCAEQYGSGFEDVACLEASGAIDTVKRKVERALATYTDVEPLLPWSRLDDDGLTRLYGVHQDDGNIKVFQVGMFPYPDTPRATALAVLYLGLVDSQGNQIE